MSDIIKKKFSESEKARVIGNTNFKKINLDDSTSSISNDISTPMMKTRKTDHRELYNTMDEVKKLQSSIKTKNVIIWAFTFLTLLLLVFLWLSQKLINNYRSITYDVVQNSEDLQTKLLNYKDSNAQLIQTVKTKDDQLNTYKEKLNEIQTSLQWLQ